MKMSDIIIAVTLNRAIGFESKANEKRIDLTKNHIVSSRPWYRSGTAATHIAF